MVSRFFLPIIMLAVSKRCQFSVPKYGTKTANLLLDSWEELFICDSWWKDTLYVSIKVASFVLHIKQPYKHFLHWNAHRSHALYVGQALGMKCAYYLKACFDIPRSLPFLLIILSFEGSLPDWNENFHPLHQISNDLFWKLLYLMALHMMGVGRREGSFFPNLPSQLIQCDNIEPTALQMAELT